MNPVVLYDNAFSPYAFKVRATLYEKGIEHEKHEMRTAADREALLRVNPRGEVPALTHGDALVYDSSVICEYLETEFPEPSLFPADTAGQARCRLLERLADGPLDGCVITLAIVKLFKPELDAEHPEVAKAASEHLTRFHEFLDDTLADGEYLCGELSRADLALVPQISGGAILGFPPSGSRLAAWHERINARPGVKRAWDEFMQTFEASRSEADPFFRRDHLHVRDHRLEWAFRLGLGPWLVSELEAGKLAFSPVP